MCARPWSRFPTPISIFSSEIYLCRGSLSCILVSIMPTASFFNGNSRDVVEDAYNDALNSGNDHYTYVDVPFSIMRARCDKDEVLFIDEKKSIIKLRRKSTICCLPD